MRRRSRRWRGSIPISASCMRRFGSAQVRASGTVGGNIANGSPIGDLRAGPDRARRRARTAAGRRPAHPAARTLLHRLSPAGPAARRVRAADRRAEARRRTRSFAPTRSRSVSTRTSPRSMGRSGSPSTGGASRRPASPMAAWRRRRSAPPRPKQRSDRPFPRRARELGRGHGGRRPRLSAPRRSSLVGRLSRHGRAAISLFKALSETASGETRATRIVGQREALEAAE